MNHDTSVLSPPALAAGTMTRPKPLQRGDMPPPGIKTSRSYDQALPPERETWIELDGVGFGARADERGPIGGGAGYAGIVTTGDYAVGNIAELIAALAAAQPGQTVFVAAGAVLDLSSRVAGDGFVLEVPGGVTLASSRGEAQTPGAALLCDEFKTQPLIRVTGPGARITGLRILGPDTERQDEWDYRCFGPENLGNKHYYSFPVSQGIWCEFDRLEVDNCELSGWAHAAVLLRDGSDHLVHHNWMHHNQRQALGYHVSHNRSATSVIEYNLFDYARHAIAGEGRPGSGYEARHNIILPHANGHAFDMHGGSDRKDGTDIAGGYMRVHHNTFMVTYHEVNRPAISIRGVPEQEVVVEHNWFYHERPGRETVKHYARTRVGLNLYGRPPLAWLVAARIAWQRAPSLLPDAPPGELAVTIINAGAQPANVYCPAIPLRPEADVHIERRQATVRLPAGAHQTIAFPVAYTGQIGAGAVEVCFDRWAGGLMLLADGDVLSVPILGREMTVLPDLVNDIPAAPAATPPYTIVFGNRVVAEIRFALAGDGLNIHAAITDHALVRTADLWTGSCIEVFLAGADQVIEQFMIVPAVADAPAAGYGVVDGRPLAVADISVRSEVRAGGYVCEARVPLRQRVAELALEFQVDQVTSPEGPRRHLTLFASREPFAESAGYARFDCR